MPDNSASRVEALKPRPGSYLSMWTPDLHYPFVDPKALGALLLSLELLQPREFGFLGDASDCHAWSSHPPKSKMEAAAHSFNEYEMKPLNRMIDMVEDNSERQKFLEGNHEDRVERRLLEMGAVGKAIEDLVSPRILLTQDRKNLEYVPYQRDPSAPIPHVKIADDYIATHGWSVSKHAAAKHLELAKGWSILFGHVHRAQVHCSREPITGRLLRAVCPGTMSLLQPLYLQHNPSEWSHGFELVWVTNDRKSWTSYTVMIRDGVCVLPGGLKIDGTSNRGRQLVNQVITGR